MPSATARACSAQDALWQASAIAPPFSHATAASRPSRKHGENRLSTASYRTPGILVVMSTPTIAMRRWCCRPAASLCEWRPPFPFDSLDAAEALAVPYTASEGKFSYS